MYNLERYREVLSSIKWKGFSVRRRSFDCSSVVSVRSNVSDMRMIRTNINEKSIPTRLIPRLMKPMTTAKKLFVLFGWDFGGNMMSLRSGKT